ncbi:uncharacterized protein LOC112607704 [Theropithecus gelada]|uniref:uncharacterized protein LOC112607704 n=1 Tax=Theropithecus gelada TaxID=9565 RepID=UPI000DC15F42|nr:uncharacterized protein LOC112607704 [Theropithecus gelada]
MKSEKDLAKEKLTLEDKSVKVRVWPQLARKKNQSCRNHRKVPGLLAPLRAKSKGQGSEQAPPGNLSPEAAASSKLGGAGCAAGPRRPGARPWCWRLGGRGRWRVPERRVSHTRRLGRRQWQRQAPPGRARARGLGRAPAASLRRSLSLPAAFSSAARQSSPQRSQEGRREPRTPRSSRGSRRSRPRRRLRLRRGRSALHGGGLTATGSAAVALGPSALPRVVGRDPMRRAHEGREIPSSGGARRRAVLQLPEPESCRQEAAAAART